MKTYILLKKFFKEKIGYIILLSIVIILGIILESINPYLFGKIIDNISKNKKMVMGRYFFWYTAILFSIQILGCFEKILGKSIVLNIVNRIKHTLFGCVVAMPYYKSQEFEQGELLNRIEFDASIIVDYYMDFVSSIFMIIGNFFISLYFLMKISNILTLISVVLISLMYIVNILFKNTVKKLQEDIKIFSDQYYSWLQEKISNLLGIKVYQEEKKVSRKFSDLLSKEYNLYMENEIVDSKIEFIRGIINLLLDVSILFISIKYIEKGEMTIGGLVAFSTYLSKLLIAISKILDININKQAVNISYQRISSLLEKNIYPKEEKYIEKINQISFDSVSFGYNKKCVLNNVAFELKEEGIYSFVGENGSGKTTILSLIEKLYSCQKGKIKVNNILIDDINTDCYRKEIIYLTKKPYFINGTILENIKIGNENVTMEEIQEVCKKIGIHNYIMELKEGYNSSIGEEGKKLSSGQRQKIAFVRGDLRRASVVLLDEATSDVDGQSEKNMCNLIKEMSRRAIIINISHRELSVKMSKKIFFLHGGEIIDEGTHEELLNRNKNYEELFSKYS